jgi:hypothetical protein
MVKLGHAGLSRAGAEGAADEQRAGEIFEIHLGFPLECRPGRPIGRDRKAF